MRPIPTVALLAMVAPTVHAQRAPAVTDVVDQFRAVDWDSRAKSAKPDPADEAWRIRVRAEHALIGTDPPPVRELIGLLGDANRHVRALGAFCLGAIGDDAAVEPLEQVLAQDPDATTRLYAAQALGRIGNPSAAEALAEAEAGTARSVAYVAHIAHERLVNGPPAGLSLRRAARPPADFEHLATPTVGEPAPDIELTSSDGNAVSLSSFRGQPVVLMYQVADW